MNLIWDGLSAALIPPAVHVFMPDLSTYRGLSGIDSAVFMLLAVSIFADSWERRDWSWTIVCMAVFAGFAAKTAFESATGTTFFVDSTAAQMRPVPLAHVVGAGIGILCGLKWTTPAKVEAPVVPGHPAW